MANNYFVQRAAQERRLASQASDPQAARAHLELAKLHEQAAGLGQGKPVNS